MGLSGQDPSRGRCDDSDRSDATDEHPASIELVLAATRDSSSSRLENLPAELRVLLLSSMPDLPTLRSLVCASPVLHAQYRNDHNSILRACMSREMDGIFVDAYATVMSRVGELGPRTDKTITDYLDTYKTWLPSSTPFLDIKSIHPGRIRWMVAYPHICRSTLGSALYMRQQGASNTEINEVIEEQVAQSNHNIELSRSEEIRIFRALYRYETYHHLFGQNQGRRRGGFRHHEIHDLFFCLFDPWDAEAIGCIEAFVRDRYKHIFNRVKADLHPRNDRFKLENGVYNPESSYDLEAELYGWHLGQPRRMTDGRCRLIPPNPRDEAEQRRDPICFVGDAVPPDGPPFAWVALWGGKYSHIYGEYVPEAVKRWGYIMWDERRWADMGADGNLVARQWDTSPDLVKDIENDHDWSPVGG
ncbi:hypothetical protein NUW58_g5066 [Xylaria curta]|uniref:Uncharacterized protein n=1 Tax=Xylaria curta TaxID=42375 RepID=A0ACC1P5P2_9PEZI|nr:hypothetical protein NUW58_g5066 [Xylaria curta]